MASKTLDLSLILTVLGAEQAKVLETAVDALKESLASLKGRSLDDILNGTKAKNDIDLLIEKTHQFFDLLTVGGKTPLDLQISKLRPEFDILTQQARGFIDLLAQTGKIPLDFNLVKMEAEAKKARAEVNALGASFSRIGAVSQGGGFAEMATGANAATASVNRLGASHRSLFQDLQQGRRALLLFQTALFGLGIAAAAKGTLDLVIGFDKVKQSISAVFGESHVAEEFAFIKVQAERLGLDLSVLGTEYGKLAIATRALGLTQTEMRDLFLSIVEAGARLHLSTDDIQGALLAVQQIASKGVVSMEELRRQLGNSIPGATSIAAKALGVTEAKLFQLVSTGQLASDVFLRNFPAALRASFGVDQSTRIETTQAAIQRFKNALKELIDTAVRAGALDVFIGSLKSLTAVFRDPATIQWLIGVSQGIKSLGEFAKEHVGAIKTLGLVLAGFLAFRFGTAFLGGIEGKLLGIGKAALGTAQTTSALDQALTKLADGTAKAEGPLATLAARLVVIAGLASGPLAILITVGVVGMAAAAAVTELLGKQLDAKLKLAEAEREEASQGRIIATILATKIAANKQYADAVVESTVEVNRMNAEELRGYAEVATAAQTLAKGEEEIANAQIARLRAQMAQGKLTSAQVDVNIREIDRLKVVAQDAAAKAETFTLALAEIDTAAEKGGIGLTDYAAHLQAVAASLVPTQESTDKVVDAFGKLDKASQAVVTGFQKSIEASGGVTAALAHIFPKDLVDNPAVSALAKVGDILTAIVQRGQDAAPVVEGVAKALDKLNADQLATFQARAETAFELAGKGATGLVLILKGSLNAALKNLGIDAEDAGGHISKAFLEIQTNVAIVLSNTTAAVEQIQAAIQKGIDTAKTREELLALKSTIENTGIAGKNMGVGVIDALVRLDDKIRLSAGILNSSLGDSFKRLGIDTKEALKGIADQADIDFTRVKLSGLATALELEEAFRKMADEVTKANNGIPPIKIVIQAVDFNAFDVIVKAAELASVRVRKAIEGAIPLLETRAQAIALGDAISLAFEKGKISVEEFGKLITEVGFKLRELAAKPVGELAAAADLLGVKTTEQLKAISDNAKEAFNTIANSGQFTNEQLAKGAQQFLDAYLAANQGVVDSFDPVVAKALEIVKSVEGVTQAIDNMKNKASEPIDTGNLRDRSVEELQKQLADTVRMYREIGVMNVEQLQIVQAIQAELNRKGAEAGDKLRAAAEAADKAVLEQQQARGASATPPAPGGGSGGAVVGAGVNNVNFTFNGASLTPEDIKRHILPVLNDVLRRSR